MRATLALIGLAVSVTLAAPSWEGDFFDPDDLKVTVSRTADTITAKSADWEISGTLVTDSRARLAGLEGTLDERGIRWSNGVTWSRKALPEPIAPISWPGVYHGVLNDVDVTLYEISDTKVVAEGDRHGKKWRADGHISGDTIHMFGISGRMHGPSEIRWTNNEVWKRKPAPVASPPPPPLLAAGVVGAQPDYWAADFAAHAEHPEEFADEDEADGLSAGAVNRAAGASQLTGAGGVGAHREPAPAKAKPRTAPDQMFGSYETVAGSDPQVTDTARSGAVAVPASASGGGGLFGPLLLVCLLVAAGSFVGRSYRRHGTLEKHLLLADARKLIERARKCGGRRQQMQRIRTDDQAADRDSREEDGASSGTGAAHYYALAMLYVSDARARLEAAVEQSVATVVGLSRATEVVNASDDLQAADMEAADFGGRRSRDSREDGERVAKRADAISFNSAAEYEWEGEKLSWEAGSGLPPSKLPAYEEYRLSHEIDDPDEEEC